MIPHLADTAPLFPSLSNPTFEACRDDNIIEEMSITFDLLLPQDVMSACKRQNNVRDDDDLQGGSNKEMCGKYNAIPRPD